MLASGVVLAATNEGLVAAFADGRFRRIDLRDRALEKALASTAASDVPIGAAVRPEVSDVLVAQGVLVPARSVRVDDRIGLGATPPKYDTEHSGSIAVFFGWLSDPAFHDAVRACAEARSTSIVACASSAGAWLVHDDATTSPCPHCALLLDAEAARNAVALERLGKSGTLPSPPLEHASVLRAWLARSIRSDVPPPSPGRALVWDARKGTQRWESIAPHPSCSCRARGRLARAIAPDTDVRSASRRRFAPVVAVSRDGDDTAPARVVYRGGVRSWPIEPAAFGVAMASPPNAPPRALAEAIERFSMLHAPPDVVAASASEVADALSSAAIESLLFRAEERSAADFPFPPFSTSTPLDWSWATELASGERALVPTTLVGRVRDRTARLAHATSNGYACHVDRERAIRGALLEIVERDAILLAFHLSRRLPRIDGLDGALGVEGEVYAWLATQDVELPVVLAAALLDGRTRIAAAAGVTFDEAVTRTAAELRALVASRSSATRGAGATPLEGSPETHQQFYDGKGREHLRALAREAERVDARALAARWPTDSGAIAPIRHALDAAGLRAWIVDRSLPSVFGRRWHVVRALVPGAVELSWGSRFRRLASPRIAKALAAGAVLSDLPHPIA